MKEFDKEWFEKIFAEDDISLYEIYGDLSEIFYQLDNLIEERAPS